MDEEEEMGIKQRKLCVPTVLTVSRPVDGAVWGGSAQGINDPFGVLSHMLKCALRLASLHRPQSWDETRLEQLTEGNKLNCSHSTRCLGPLSSYLSLAEPVHSQNSPWPRWVWAFSAKLFPRKCIQTLNSSLSQEKPPGSWLQGTRPPFLLPLLPETTSCSLRWWVSPPPNPKSTLRKGSNDPAGSEADGTEAVWGK